MNNNHTEIFKVDIEKVIRSQKARYIKNMPGFAVRYIKKIIREDELNKITEYAGNTEGIEFIKRCTEYLNIKCNFYDKDNIPDKGRFIFACNHPLGGIDFFAAILSISENYDKIKVIANELLMHVKPLREIFLPVNVFGKSSEKAKEAILKAMASEDIQIMTFPAGEVARKYNGKPDDGEWHRSFIRNAVEFKRDIIPVFIDAENSEKFYRTANIRKMLGLKWDIELFLLPQELVKQKNKTINVIFGKPISYQTFDKSKTPLEWAREVKKTVYGLKKHL
ncbi:MAG: glycerol acyltransferase [Chlorobi bacterium]|nr:glycerol acyltransferase [Chlorobiota bacterium]